MRFAYVPILGLLLVVACGSGDTNVASPGGHCGGNTSTAQQCGPGYTCTPSADGGPAFGDVGGTCQPSAD